jgi:hypothetical protein
MQVHSATCSCSVELYKQWYTLADFLPTGTFPGFFSKYHYFVVDKRSCDVGGHYIYIWVPCSSFIRDGKIGDGEIEEGVDRLIIVYI